MVWYHPQMMACLITDEKSIPSWPTWKYINKESVPKSKYRNSSDAKGYIRRSGYSAMYEYWSSNGFTPTYRVDRLPNPKRVLRTLSRIFPKLSSLEPLRKWK